MTQVASIRVPMGSYIVNAKVLLVNNSAAVAGATCILFQTNAGTVLDRAEGSLAGSAVTGTLTLHAATQVTGAGGDHVELLCQVSAGATVFASYPQLTAIQVGSLTAPGP
jgi:hypothetical protein